MPAGLAASWARTAHSGGSGGTYTHAFYHADRGGNTTYLLQANQTLGASYYYDPYGRELSSSGPLAAANTLGFSSKERLTASGLYYYGYRFYDPVTQRWLNRDPIEELGGLNLYAAFANGPINKIDGYGDVVDTIWDAANIGMGVGSLIDNIRDGNYWDAAFDGLGVVADTCAALAPGIPGGAATAIKTGRKAANATQNLAAAERAKNAAKGIDSKDLGPSGKPKIHTKDHPTRKRAKDATREEGKGPPINHPSDKGQPPHYHPTDECGDKTVGGTHHNYPRRKR